MGRPMAKSLLRAGFDLIVHDRVPAAVDDVVGFGARNGGSLAGTAEAPVVVTMLPDTPDVEAVLFRPGGLAETMRSGTVLVDMS